MKNRIMSSFLLLLLTVLPTLSIAQEWNWGDNESDLKGLWLTLEREVHLKRWETAKKLFDTLELVKPDLHPSLYINGVKIYKQLESQSTGEVKQEYQNKVLDLYNQRIKLYGETPDLLSRKGLSLWKYRADVADTAEINQIVSFYTHLISLNHPSINDKNYYYYLMVNLTKLNKQMITPSDYLTIYHTNINKVSGKYSDKLTEVTIELISIYADKALKEHEYQNAYIIFKELLKLGLDSAKRYNTYHNLAAIDFELNNKEKCKSNIDSALTYQNNPEIYSLLGDLYYNMFDQYSDFDQKLVFCLAYKYYKMSGDTERIKSCLTQLPSKEEAFLRNLSNGDTKYLGGWINQSVIIYTR